MKPSFTEKVNKIFSSKIWYYIENIIVVGLLFCCIKSLTDYDNVYYQTWKNEAAAKAILAFTAIVFIIRKVKLLNWQSLVATLLFGAVVFERLHFWDDAEDILNAVKPQLAAEWLSLMIIIDMILYKNVKNLFKGVNYLAILYILMAIGMIWRRHDRMDPIVLIFPMFLFALVKMDAEKEDWFLRRFIDGWFISFIYVVARSFIENPYNNYRYYGYFLNIGQFGIYMVCCFTVALFAFKYTKEKYRRLHFCRLISVIWLLFVCYMIYIIDTRTTILGVFFCLIILFLFDRKNTSKRILIRRGTFIILASLIILVFCLTIIKLCLLISDEWLAINYTGLLSPLVHNVLKLRSIGTLGSDMLLSKRLYEAIDLFSSGRLTIISAYRPYFNYDGNSSMGLFIEKYDYWAYSAHNTYVQFLIEYGYLSIFELISLVILSVGFAIKRYINNKTKKYYLLVMLWITSMIGIWFGESNTFFYPISFFGFMFIAMLLKRTDTN